MHMIAYTVRFGTAEIERICEMEVGDGILFVFKNCTPTSMRFGDGVRPCKEGTCRFERCADGIYTPIVYTLRGMMRAESFELAGGAPRLIPRDDAYIRELAARAEKLEARIAELEGRMGGAERAIKGNHIF